jgi:hypothetical protein
LSLQFFEFSTIFCAFSNYQQNDFTIGDSLSQRGPWNFSKPHRYAPSSRLGTWKDLEASNWVPIPNGRRGGAAGATVAGARGKSVLP